MNMRALSVEVNGFVNSALIEIAGGIAKQSCISGDSWPDMGPPSQQ